MVVSLQEFILILRYLSEVYYINWSFIPTDLYIHTLMIEHFLTPAISYFIEFN